jgi:hypothetical protein
VKILIKDLTFKSKKFVALASKYKNDPIETRKSAFEFMDKTFYWTHTSVDCSSNETCECLIKITSPSPQTFSILLYYFWAGVHIIKFILFISQAYEKYIHTISHLRHSRKADGLARKFSTYSHVNFAHIQRRSMRDALKPEH